MYLRFPEGERDAPSGCHASGLVCASTFRQCEADDVFTGAHFIRLGAPCDVIALRWPMA